jgi:hypothetical protein
MKKKISLTELSRNELQGLSAGKASVTIGPITVLCTCGCYYEGEPGGSSEISNANANMEGGLHSQPR